MEVVGIEKVDYVSRKSGKNVKGVKLHMCGESDNVQGCAVSSEFVPERVECNVTVGDKVKLFYNKFGQVDKVALA